VREQGCGSQRWLREEWGVKWGGRVVVVVGRVVSVVGGVVMVIRV
jgi:hypothetical protein